MVTRSLRSLVRYRVGHYSNINIYFIHFFIVLYLKMCISLPSNLDPRHNVDILLLATLDILPSTLDQKADLICKIPSNIKKTIKSKQKKNQNKWKKLKVVIIFIIVTQALQNLFIDSQHAGILLDSDYTVFTSKHGVYQELLHSERGRTAL